MSELCLSLRKTYFFLSFENISFSLCIGGVERGKIERIRAKNGALSLAQPMFALGKALDI